MTPFLWFNGQVEEAVNFYTAIFKNSRIIGLHRFGNNGKIMSATFQLEGQQFMALDGGPHYSFTPAISFFVNCTNQQEVDEFWDKLSAAGEIQQCGWLIDKFGVSWQIIPTNLSRLMGDPDPVKSQRVLQAMLKMKKIEIGQLEAAYRG
ncbi:MAG: VOC family protein [Saprospiraceae bacterium]|nr:VOC family protein [Saprospiraceae bacterium]